MRFFGFENYLDCSGGGKEFEPNLAKRQRARRVLARNIRLPRSERSRLRYFSAYATKNTSARKGFLPLAVIKPVIYSFLSASAFAVITLLWIAANCSAIRCSSDKSLNRGYSAFSISSP